MISQNLKLSEKIIEPFYETHRKFLDPEITFLIEKGGRNGGKSFFIAEEIILDIINNPVSWICCRKVARTLEKSVFNQLMRAIRHLEIEKFFKIKKSPLEITYTPRGNSVVFAGIDDPVKIKSLVMSKFPLRGLWIEELAEFKSLDEVDIIKNTILREKLPNDLKYKVFYSFNPPKRKQHWCNMKFETVFIPENTCVNHTTYLDNPYVSEQFIFEAEIVKETAPQKYEWEYLGKPTGSGIVPFSNLNFREITDEEIAQFDNLKNGLDWGYGDPMAMVRLHYDKHRGKIYVFGEIFGQKIMMDELTKRITANKWNNIVVTADSANPDKIQTLNDKGIKCIGVDKSGVSVEFGEQFLDELEEIVIDPRRCPNTAREFEAIDYKLDKYGNITGRLEDKNNHSIDAVRYAMRDDMTRERKLESLNIERIF